MRFLIPALLVVLLLAVLLLAVPAVFDPLVLWVRSLQVGMQRDLVQAVRNWQAAPGLESLLAMATVCFLYGVFHAIGPGHGKAVLSAYAATTQVRARTVFALAGLTAWVQATVAVVVVGVALWGLGSTVRWATKQIDAVFEPLSYAAIAAIGLWMLWGGVRSLRRAQNPAVPTVHCHHDHADHGHHHHDHDHSACCGHDHAPPVTADLRSGLALAFASGLRPCTGSLLVVGLCFGMGLWGMGIAASYAIGIGTAITVAALAGSVRAVRGPLAWVGRVARIPDHTWSGFATSLRLISGVLIVLLGGIMLHAALTTPKPPL